MFVVPSGVREDTAATVSAVGTGAARATTVRSTGAQREESRTGSSGVGGGTTQAGRGGGGSGTGAEDDGVCAADVKTATTAIAGVAANTGTHRLPGGIIQ
jgi:hypothetical protein